MKRFAIVLSMFAVLAAGPVAARPSGPADFAPLARWIEQTGQATGHPSGIAIAVVKGDQVIYQGYFGLSDIARKIPVRADTAFYIASATKPFTALEVLLKAQAGKLDTDLSLQAMYPDLRFTGFDARAVTIRDLLTHTSGIDNLPLVWATAFSGVHDAATLRALVGQSRADADAAHGTFKYTNVGYNIVSVWLDHIFAMPWQDQLAQAIFEPLGMRHTTAYITRAQAKGWSLARPYSLASATPEVPLYLSKVDETMQAAGGMLSTAPDLARFLMAQWDAARMGAADLAPAIARSHEPQAHLHSQYLDFARSGYAWGWYTGSYKNRRMLHHFGGFAGFHAHLSFMPDQRIGLVVLCNEDMLCPREVSLIADYVYGTLLGEPDVQATVAGRFAELRSRAGKLAQAVGKQRAALRARAWQLSLPRAAYAGTYMHPLLGRMTIALDDAGVLSVRWGRLRAEATGYDKPDTARVELVPNAGEVLTFDVRANRVASVELDGMVFDRVR